MDLAWALAAPLVAACAYQAAALAVTLRFVSRRGPAATPENAGGRAPGVSILKPAAGAGDELAECLASHAGQEYPDFEILVGLTAADSAAYRAVKEVRATCPRPRLVPVRCPNPRPGNNPKVQILERLVAKAGKPVLLAVDADISASPGHVRTVTDELSLPGVGLVTCLYRAQPARSLSSRAEALMINTAFPAQVLLAERLQGLRFALGASIAVRRETLSTAGGIGSARKFIGDDFHVGARVAASGLAVKVSSAVVRTHLRADEGWHHAWQRQLRWSRTIRKQRPRGHAGLAVAHATAWSALALAAEPATLWPLALAAMALRYAAAGATCRAVQGRLGGRGAAALPLVDLAAMAVWACSYAGSAVIWSGQRIRLGKRGRILA